MGRYLTLLLFFALVSLTFAWGVKSVGNWKSKEAEFFDTDVDHFPNGEGTADDPTARIDYELMRLADPHTGKVPSDIRAKELAFANHSMKTSAATGAQFDSKGPYNIGGRTRAIAFDIDNEDILLAGGVTGGMWRSTDGGQTFDITTTPDQLHSITTIAQDTRTGKHNVWYYGTGEQYAVVSPTYTQGSGNGIYKSTNGGQSWQPLASTVSSGLNYTYNKTGFNYVWKVLPDPTDANNDVVFAAVVNGIYKSIDGGATWTGVLGLDTNISSISNYTDIVITPSGILYAYINGTTSHSGVWRSADHGTTWKKINPGSWPSNTARVVMAVVPEDENQLFMIANTPSTGKNKHSLWHYTYLSGDGSGSAGGFWDNRSANLPDLVCEVFYNYKFGLYSSQDGYDMCLAVSEVDSNLVFLGGTNVYRSTDGFKTNTHYQWVGGYHCDTIMPSNYVYPNHHPDQHLMVFSHTHPNTLYSANDGGIFKTTDNLATPLQWQSLNNGYVNSQFYTIAVEQADVTNNKILGGMQDNGTYMTYTENPAVPWINVMYGDGTYCAIPKNKDYLILSWQQGKMFKCRVDGSGHTVDRTRIDPVGASGYSFVPPFILDPTNQNKLYYAAGIYLWLQTDLDAIPLTGEEYDSISTGWVQITASSIGNPLTAGTISAIGMSASDSTRLYFGTSGGALYRLDSLGGNYTKVALSDSTLPTRGYVSSIWVSPTNSAEVIASFSNYGIKSIFRSTDSGRTWQSISGSLEQNPDGTGDGPAVFWISVLNLQDSVVYFAATTVGLYSTTHLDGDNTVWSQEAPNTIGNAIIDMVATRDYDGFVAVGSHGRGVFSTRYKDITGIEDPYKDVPHVTVSPNPFSDKAVFHYMVQKQANVVLKVYGLDGRVVANINGGQQAIGVHDMVWQAGNKGLPNGIYIYELSAGAERWTGKVILSR